MPKFALRTAFDLLHWTGMIVLFALGLGLLPQLVSP